MFDEIPSRTLQDIKETKRHGHTFVRTDNVKTVYPPTNTVCGGYNYFILLNKTMILTASLMRNPSLAYKLERQLARVEICRVNSNK